MNMRARIFTFDPMFMCFSEFAEANVGKTLTNEEQEPENLMTEKGKRKSCPEYKVLPRL